MKMETSKNRMAVLNIVKSWTHAEVLDFVKKNNLEEFQHFVERKSLDGFDFLSLSEGLVAVWRPKVDAKKLIAIIEDLKQNPLKYLNQKHEHSNQHHEDKHLAECIDESNNSYSVPKKHKPKVPVRSDSLKSRQGITENETRRKLFLDSMNNSEVEENVICNKVNFKIFQVNSVDDINLDKLVPPKSFLYSHKLKQPTFRLNPYVPMNSDEKRSQDDNFLIRKKRNTNFDNDDDEHVLQDRGYYEMSSRKSLNPMRRFSDGSIKPEENPYEELFFKNKNQNGFLLDDKKKLGILKRVLRKSTFKWERVLNKDFTTKNNPTNQHNSSTPKLSKLNERVVKKLSPKMGSNYKIKNISSFIETSKDEASTEKYKKYPENAQEIFTKKSKPNDTKTVDVETEESKINKNSQDKTPVSKGPEDVFQINDAFYEEPDYTLSSANKINDLETVDLRNDHLYELAEPFEDFNEEALYSDNTPSQGLEVEDYLEPIQIFDVTSEVVMDNLAEEVMRLFDANMESNASREDIQKSPDDVQKNDRMNSNMIPLKPPISKKPQIPPTPTVRQPKPNVPVRSFKNKEPKDFTFDKCAGTDNNNTNDRPFDTLHKWNESLRNSAKRKKEAIRKTMIDRPLPVPVENEFYYMEVGRKEAEELLEGHADGTFILRPSSQSTHLYTVTLTYQGRIYNIGCRRREDGRLALGFSKPGEQSFLTIQHLIQHHYTERLLLIQDGQKVGSTTLRKLHN